MRVPIFFFTLLTVAVGSAEPAAWPKPVKVKVEFTNTTPKKLPRGLNFDEVTVEGHDPHAVGICWIDLNRDGKPELLIDCHEGGTGGSYNQIFERARSGFRRIGGWQGGFTVLVPANGYYQFEVWSSAGGGEFSRMLYRYQRGRYHLVRLEDWRGSDTDEGFEFVRRRDPKEYDN